MHCVVLLNPLISIGVIAWVDDAHFFLKSSQMFCSGFHSLFDWQTFWDTRLLWSLQSLSQTNTWTVGHSFPWPLFNTVIMESFKDSFPKVEERQIRFWSFKTRQLWGSRITRMDYRDSQYCRLLWSRSKFAVWGAPMPFFYIWVWKSKLLFFGGFQIWFPIFVFFWGGRLGVGSDFSFIGGYLSVIRGRALPICYIDPLPCIGHWHDIYSVQCNFVNNSQTTTGVVNVRRHWRSVKVANNGRLFLR